jgi:hypothetical protein
MFLYLSLISLKMEFALFYCRSVFTEMKLHAKDISISNDDAIIEKGSDAATRLV